jgi:hypothetical protein
MTDHKLRGIYLLWLGFLISASKAGYNIYCLYLHNRVMEFGLEFSDGIPDSDFMVNSYSSGFWSYFYFTLAFGYALYILRREGSSGKEK